LRCCALAGARGPASRQPDSVRIARMLVPHRAWVQQLRIVAQSHENAFPHVELRSRPRPLAPMLRFQFSLAFSGPDRLGAGKRYRFSGTPSEAARYRAHQPPSPALGSTQRPQPTASPASANNRLCQQAPEAPLQWWSTSNRCCPRATSSYGRLVDQRRSRNDAAGRRSSRLRVSAMRN
jgi:hypothetical protein